MSRIICLALFSKLSNSNTLLHSSFKQPSYYPAIHVDHYNENQPEEPVYLVDTPPEGSFGSFMKINDLILLCPFSKDGS